MNQVQLEKPVRVIPGSRIQLIHMEDPYPVPIGTCGTVTSIDSMNQIHVKWDNGSTLAIIPQIDQFTVIG